MVEKITDCCTILRTMGYQQHQINEIIRFCVGAKAIFALEENECIFLLTNLEKHIELAAKYLPLKSRG